MRTACAGYAPTWLVCFQPSPPGKAPLVASQNILGLTAVLLVCLVCHPGARSFEIIRRETILPWRQWPQGARSERDDVRPSNSRQPHRRPEASIVAERLDNTSSSALMLGSRVAGYSALAK